MRKIIPFAAIGLICAAVSLAGPPVTNPQLQRTPDLLASRPVTLTGDLGQLRVAVNGDFSGWVLIKPERSFNLDVSAVLVQARKLSGERVNIHGSLTVGHFLGGAWFQQVRVTSIRRAPGP